MTVKGYDLIGEWAVSNMGHTAMAKRGGKKFFLKRYGEYKMPRRDSSTSDKLYDKMKAEFDSFKGNRIAINEALASLAGPGGNIILPTDWFVDDIFYVEATEFVENLIEDEEILRLSHDEILFIMLTAAGALGSIHRKKIVHSDLKRTNILAARNSAGKTVAKIIDFDRSYFIDKIRPEELGGDQSFMSPELAQCFMYDLADEALAYLSLKSDIFSLGLVYHDYLAGGNHPQITGLTGKLKERAEEGKTVYCCEALLAGGNLVISSRIKEEYLRHLIAAMLQPEPEDRPSAQEVLEILKSKKVVPLKEGSQIKIEGEGTDSTDEPVSVGPHGPSSGTPEPPRPEPPKPVGFCLPWAEHKIKFNEDKLKSGGYVSSEQMEHKGTKCYQFFKASGDVRRFTVENLILLGFASRESGDAPLPPTPTPHREIMEDGELWEKDSAYSFDMDAIHRSGYKSIAREKRKEVEGYSLIKPSGDLRFMTIETLKLLGFVKKK